MANSTDDKPPPCGSTWEEIAAADPDAERCARLWAAVIEKELQVAVGRGTGLLNARHTAAKLEMRDARHWILGGGTRNDILSMLNVDPEYFDRALPGAIREQRLVYALRGKSARRNLIVSTLNDGPLTLEQLIDESCVPDAAKFLPELIESGLVVEREGVYELANVFHMPALPRHSPLCQGA